MRRLLNILFVTTQGAYLAKEGESVLVRNEGETLLRVPVHTLEGIVCFGNVGASPFLLGHCAENGVAVSFLTENGRFLARVQGPVSGNVLLRRRQYRLADDPGFAAGLARSVVIGKAANCCAVLRRAARDHPERAGAPALSEAADRIADAARRAASVPDLDGVRGLEGEMARTYFGVFGELVLRPGEEFAFRGRSRRPPLDRMNALLSFLYTLLAHDVRGALEGVGLDPAVGYLHRDRPGRPSLALDLMEEFRPFFADRLALSLVNRGQVRAEGFVEEAAGAVRMDDATRKAVLVAYQTRKRDELAHPFLGETVPVGMLFHVQALLLARHLRGDLDAYPPFAWR